ncbi:hypothetical protein HZS61_006109 [Fusarium oxysporum f. sp. conglutinans]|uniref:Uncharacterized protein n=1 Tax=Fusarium oxysporum f. sp. conglutinans TaxID=100902 RepID=A0A8H6GCA1_FUSOX|nr:hypothetical protein HZS61_006109 [Fusarium oxysporum f. sp. conglutinans]
MYEFNTVKTIPTPDNQVNQIAWKNNKLVLFLTTVFTGADDERVLRLAAHRGWNGWKWTLRVGPWNGWTWKWKCVDAIKGQYTLWHLYILKELLRALNIASAMP